MQLTSELTSAKPGSGGRHRHLFASSPSACNGALSPRRAPSGVYAVAPPARCGRERASGTKRIAAASLLAHPRPPPPPPVIPALAGWGGRQARCIRRGSSQGGDGPRARCLHQNRLSCHPNFSVTSMPADPCSWGFNVNLNVEKIYLLPLYFSRRKKWGMR